MYEFFNWKYFGLNGKTEIVKEFNNGYAWIKFTEPTDWEKFIKVYDFANESTGLIINALDHTDKVKFQDRAKSVNKFSAMYEILKQKGLPVHYINAGLIIEFLES